ncbi:transcriptional regulator, ArsR family [Pacificibacter marinus]|uniref:Helix-turn-helix domain protein n=2 Tax=Pacificibacter marinus TaxID=658057 RepID=A0A1Y5RTT4_9RHOB|nr:transcriptional regulator, ArsR family [Pacificibacter marinus]SLN25064.1 Helix-turn-helix domain protein [Pacificibacter marinus]
MPHVIPAHLIEIAALALCANTKIDELHVPIDKTIIIVLIGIMMTHTSAALSLAALGHDTRLTIFRLLVRAGNDGLNIGDIGTHLGMAASTLAYHIKTLVDAGLVTQERQGRQIVNRVDFDVMHQTVSFLTSECCTGVALTQENAA